MGLAEKVAARFLNTYDSRFAPPPWMVGAVDQSLLPTEVLNVWKYVVSKAGDRFDPKNGKSWSGAIQHWRHKCKKMGIPIPPEYIKGGGGEGAAGRWGVSSGEVIEDWVKEKLITEGLHDDLRETAHDVQMEIGSLHRYVEEAQETIEKHLKAMAAPSDRAGKNRQRWLQSAKTKHQKYLGEMETAQDKLEKLVEASDKYNKSKVMAVAFEKEAQFLMQLALRELGDVKTVLKHLRQAEQRFAEGMDIPGGEFQYSAEQMEKYKSASAPKQAGFAEMLDKAWGVLNKVWGFIGDAWEDFKDWASSLVKVTSKMDSTFDDAS